MSQWIEWDGQSEAPDGGYPMVFDIEFNAGEFAGQTATVWSDRINWCHVRRYRLTDDAVSFLKEARH